MSEGFVGSFLKLPVCSRTSSTLKINQLFIASAAVHPYGVMQPLSSKSTFTSVPLYKKGVLRHGDREAILIFVVLCTWGKRDTTHL
jgi:hypothetical protein